jgi:hypothetical protein
MPQYCYVTVTHMRGSSLGAYQTPPISNLFGRVTMAGGRVGVAFYNAARFFEM